MSYIQVKQKYQVTIPAAIRKKIALCEGDTLEAIEKDGIIVLIPQKLVRRELQDENPSLISLAGKNRNSGLYASADDVDAFISSIRSEWN